MLLQMASSVNNTCLTKRWLCEHDAIGSIRIIIYKDDWKFTFLWLTDHTSSRGAVLNNIETESDGERWTIDCKKQITFISYKSIIYVYYFSIYF